MCGIAGILTFDRNESPVDGELLDRMRDTMIHRGPDGGRSWISPEQRIGLAFRRLAIIDLAETAMQPMRNEDGSIYIVFNGEIYNHAEIRAELQRIGGHTWQTDHSDTEVIIHAYEEWGIDCLQKFCGMFALAIYDAGQQRAYLVRDRLGKKPLFYLQKGRTLFFASEAQVLLQAAIVPTRVNEEAIYHYLTFLTVPAPQSFYRDIAKVEAGYYLEITAERVTKQPYWDIADAINRVVVPSFNEAVTQTETLLETSMRYRNIADVPVAVALSGGLDSSLDLYYAKHYNPQICAINLAYDKTSVYDESQIARRYSNELSVEFIGKRIDEAGFRELIADYLMIQRDMPIGDPNGALLFGIAQIARARGAKVLLVGEGGDELGGYPIYQNLATEERWLKHLPRWAVQISKYTPVKIAKRLDIFYDGKLVSRRQIHGFTEYEKRLFWRGNRDYNSYQALMSFQDQIRDDLEDSFLRKILNIEYKLRLPEMILARVDYPSMATSVEARSPFMDHALIEYSASLPFGIKMRDGPKSILRQIARSKLPQFLFDQPKVGFGMLLTPFLSKTLPEWYREELLSVTSPLEQYVHKSFLTDLYDRSQQKQVFGYQLWILYALNRWLKLAVE